MRQVIRAFALVLALKVVGCGAFSPEELTLSPAKVEQVATIAAEREASGAVESIDERIRKSTEAALGVAVERVIAKFDAVSGAVTEIKAVLPALAKEAAAVGGTTALDSIARNPKASGIGGAVVAVATAIFGVWSRRASARKEAVRA